MILYILYTLFVLAVTYICSGYRLFENQLFTISFFFITSSILTVVTLKKMKRMQANVMKMSKSLSVYKSIIKTSNNYWIIFTKSGETVAFSENMQNILPLNDNMTKDSFIEFFINLTNENNSIIIRDITNGITALIEYGKFFEEYIEISDKSFHIYGQQISSFGHILNTIIMEDISVLQNKINDIKKENSNLHSELKLINDVFDSFNFPIWIRNDDAKLIKCNSTYASIINQNKNYVIQNNIPLIKGSMFGEGDSLAKNVLKTKSNQSIDQNIVVDGKKCKYLFSEYYILNGCTCGYAYDKTQEENAIKDLDRHINALSDILESLSSAIAIFDTNTKLAFFNSSYQKFTSLDEMFLSTRPKLSEVLEEMRRKHKLPDTIDFTKYKKEKVSLFTAHFTSNEDYEYFPNGRTYRVIEYPYPLGGVIFMYEDVTDNLTLERKHNTLIEVQKETLDNLYEGVVVYGSDNKIRFFNPAFLKIWDLNQNECSIGTHISNIAESMKKYLNYTDDWNFYKDNLISTLTDRIPKSGKIFRTNNSVINFSYIPLSDGAHVHSYIDVTDSWKIEKALYEKNFALEEANQIKSKFIKSISDELKNPIKKIIHLFDTQNVEDKESKIIKYSKDVLELIDDLYDFASLESSNTQIENNVFKLSNLIESCSKILKKHKSNKVINFCNNCSPDVSINGDINKLKQMIIYIVDNILNDKPEHTILVSENDGYITFTISDIDTREDNFDRSILIVKNILEIHAGKIISNENSKNFEFKLPIYQQPVNISFSKEKIA